MCFQDWGRLITDVVLACATVGLFYATWNLSQTTRKIEECETFRYLLSSAPWLVHTLELKVDGGKIGVSGPIINCGKSIARLYEISLNDHKIRANFLFLPSGLEPGGKLDEQINSRTTLPFEPYSIDLDDALRSKENICVKLSYGDPLGNEYSTTVNYRRNLEGFYCINRETIEFKQEKISRFWDALIVK